MGPACLLALLALGAPEVRHQDLRVPGTPWVVALDVPFVEGQRLETLVEDERAKEWVLVCCATHKPDRILLLRTVSEASARLVTYAAGTPFDCEGVRCFDRSVALEKMTLGSFAALVEPPGLRLELSLVAPGQAIPRAEFERLVKSFRVLLLRRGLVADCPARLVPVLMQCTQAGPGRVGWKKGFLAQHATDWTAQWTEAEFRRLEGAPPKEQIESYSRALLLLSKQSALGKEERFVRALAEEGLGLAQYEDEAFVASTAALERACADLDALQRPELAELSFELARSQCRIGSVDAALVSITRAIALDQSLRPRANAEPYFEALRARPEFLALLRGPGAGAGK